MTSKPYLNIKSYQSLILMHCICTKPDPQSYCDVRLAMPIVYITITIRICQDDTRLCQEWNQDSRCCIREAKIKVGLFTFILSFILYKICVSIIGKSNLESIAI